ncbi:purine and uridine phosphorylase [Aspergillus lucknowensis]|uniref:Purine and uridine phosphorylase n=1 Tax=Aspergillus lucknowensis TaxID=176173 RepID=A0ABR4M7B2_9EURO
MPLNRADYTIACICPLEIEQAPLVALLDEIHHDNPLPTSRSRTTYTLGRMGLHNIVIARMPDMGNNSAAVCGTQILNDFPCLRFSLLVGIGGGVPDPEKGIDIRLGDVVVSKPQGTLGGVVQFDRGKRTSSSPGGFERTGWLSRPPNVLLATVKRLEALHYREGSRIPKILGEMLRRYPGMQRGGYVYQGSENDRLFQCRYEHVGRGDCQRCDPRETVRRDRRVNSAPVIHHGIIGSSNAVIKDGALRERLKKEVGIICVDMEGAGLMDSFPCLVIRGVSDYADSHKNDRWQPYAAAAAAAYAKELLALVPLLSQTAKSSSGWR